MAINRVPVLKRCRSLGLDPIYLGIDKKSNRQLKRANKKVSEYGLQLREKQKAKFIYGVLEKPFRNYFEKAEKMNGQTGENLMVILESRLDNVIFRLGFARTRKEARQIVDHKHVLVNGKAVNIPSYLVKAGDTIAVLHWNAQKGIWENLAVTNVADGSVTATFTSFSPVAIVRTEAAPSTGYEAPVALIAVLVVAAAGAAFCVRRRAIAE